MSRFDNYSYITPSRNRREKLRSMLATIDVPIKKIVVSDGDKETFKEFGGLQVVDHKGSVFCRNYGAENTRGNIIFGTDDIEFLPGALEKTIDLFESRFPNTDGVVGMKQEHLGHHPTGVVLMGDKFLNRYRKRWVYCPYYYHFACQEIEWFAVKVEKYVSTDFVTLRHNHPGVCKNGIDKTHEEARVYKVRDKQIRFIRSDFGFIWGLNG